MSSPRFMLDTNICIYIINKRPPQVFEHFVGMRIGDVAISSITGAELSFGITNSGSQRNQEALAKFLAPLEIVSFDEAAMHEYGSLRCRPERLGTPIGALDLLIAAHALALGSTLVSNNLREFSRVPNLKLANWASE